MVDTGDRALSGIRSGAIMSAAAPTLSPCAAGGIGHAHSGRRTRDGYTASIGSHSRPHRDGSHTRGRDRLRSRRILILSGAVLLVLLALAAMRFITWEMPEDDGTNQSAHVRPQTLVPHPVIHISGNDDFASTAASEGWSGDGTSESPYVIENYDINASGGTYCIHVVSTTVHFVIRDCHFHDATPSPGGAGIYLETVKYAIVENCVSVRCGQFGFTAWNSDYVEFANCTARLAPVGIYLSGCDVGSSIIHCSCDNGTGVPLSYGLSAYSSDGAVLRDNYVRDFKSTGIVVSESPGVTVSNTTVWRSGCGIDFAHGGSGSVLSNNTIANCTLGIHVNLAYDNHIVDNRVENSSGYGVSLSSATGGNSVWRNEFLFNNVPGVQALDNGTGNLWNVSEIGNYWSDWTSPDIAEPYGIVDLPYEIDGTGGSRDYYPLTSQQVLIPEFSSLVVPALTMILAVVIVWRRRQSR